MSKRVSKMGWIVLATLLSLVLVVLPACGGGGPAEYTLTIASTTGGSITPAAGTHSYAAGTLVNLKATADEDYHFLKWTGETSTIADVNAATTTINMTGDYYVTANFQQDIVPVTILEGPQGFPEDPSLTPQYGGKLIVLHSGSAPSNLGAPWVAGGGRDRPMARFAMEKLLGLNENGDLVAQLATAWQTDSVAKTITFTLRQGVKFHDGTDFNAEAAKWCLDKYIAGTGGTELKYCTAVEVTGPYTVKLTFSQWNPYTIRSFMSSSPGIMVSPTYGKSHTDAECKLNPVGTGPFKLKEYVPSTSLEYEAFDDYWQKGLPYLDGVLIKFVADPVVRLTSFLAKEGHVMNEFSSSTALSLEDQGYEIAGRIVHMKGICGNTATGPYSDINVRQAIAYAIPTATIVDDVFDGMFPSTDQLALPGWVGYNSSMKGYPYNPDKARQLMAAAGYSAASHLKMTLVYNSHDFDDFYTVLKDALDDVWIDLTLQFSAGYNTLIASGWGGDTLVEYQLSYNGFELSYEESLQMNLSPGMPKYVSVVTPPDYNDLYNSMLLESNLAIREQKGVALNTMAIDKYCLVIPTFGYEVFNVRQDNVHDYGYGLIASEFLPEQAWLS